MAKCEIHFTFVFGYCQIWHHRIVEELDRCIRLFLVTMPFAFFWCLRLLSFESSLIAPFTFEIGFRFFHPWCHFVWVIICFSSRTEKSLLSNPFILLIYFFSISSWCIFSILEFWLFINPFGFHSIAWDYFEYHAPIRFASFLWVYRCKLPRTNIIVKVDGSPR